jgi:hypothetical protein
MGQVQSTHRRPDPKTATAVTALLKKVPFATAAQIGDVHVTSTPQRTLVYPSGTATPPKAHKTLEYFVQSNGASKRYAFDSVTVYIECPDKHATPDNKTLLNGVYAGIVALYGKWARDGAVVHVHATLLPNGRRIRFKTRHSFLVQKNNHFTKK